MSQRSRGEMSGPLARYASGFGEELRRLGYSGSARSRHLQLMARLSRWLDDGQLDVAVLATERVEVFFQARRAAGYVKMLTPKSVVPLLGFLRGLGVVAEPSPVAAIDPVGLLLEGFGSYLASERGLVEGTVRFYVRIAGLFAVERLEVDGLDLGAVRAVDVTGFTARVCAGRGLSSSRQVVSALRALLRFLHLEGRTDLALERAVLSAAGSQPSLPRGIAAADVARLLKACDRRTAVGRRDYAILLLLARLGLRGGEVVALRLEDIDWRNGVIVVHGKGPSLLRLPLMEDVGEALAGYLRRGRPSSGERRVFLRCHAPHIGLAGTGALRSLIARACQRAGLPYASPHRLRHTLATDLLRGGATLSEIGLILGHRSSTATAVYAKVDDARLRTLARPWPAQVAA